MTREFNKQRHDDRRPSSRRTPSAGRYEEERSTYPQRPARPRLNREIVDRAWEEGAQYNHADYRPRSRGQTQQSDYRHNGRQSGYPSRNNGASNRPYSGQRSNGYGPSQERRHTSSETYGRPNGSGTSDRQRPYGRSTDRDPYNRDNGPHRSYNGNGTGRSYQRPYRDHDQERRPSRGYQRDDRSPNGYHRNGTGGYNSHNPRGRAPQRPSYENTYEGDYERFSDDRSPSPARRYDRPGNRFENHRQERPDRRHNAPPDGERHFTHMPDGRVLKGSRPEQRQQEHFWKDVAEETDGLLDHVQAADAEYAQNQPGSDEQEMTPAAKKRTAVKAAGAAPRKSAPSSEKRKRGSSSLTSDNGTGQKTRAEKPRSSGPKPSQKGFKWSSS